MREIRDISEIDHLTTIQQKHNHRFNSVDKSEFEKALVHRTLDVGWH
jgi:hypothetical protein